jgi:hypothetical protein
MTSRIYSFYDEETFVGSVPYDRLCAIPESYFASTTSFPSQEHVVRLRRHDFMLHNPFRDMKKEDEEGQPLPWTVSLLFTPRELWKAHIAALAPNSIDTWHAVTLYTLFQILSYFGLKEIYISVYQHLTRLFLLSEKSEVVQLERNYALYFLITDKWICSEYTLPQLSNRTVVNVLQTNVGKHINEHSFYDKIMWGQHPQHPKLPVMVKNACTTYVTCCIKQPSLPIYSQDYARFHAGLTQILQPIFDDVTKTLVTHSRQLLLLCLWYQFHRLGKEMKEGGGDDIFFIFVDRSMKPLRLRVIRCKYCKSSLYTVDKDYQRGDDDRFQPVGEGITNKLSFTSFPNTAIEQSNRFFQMVMFRYNICEPNYQFVMNYTGMAVTEQQQENVAFYERYTKW